jgi:CDP-diacylglycerol--glycerol-3-phosphate 3-phosphatidyltransferase
MARVRITANQVTFLRLALIWIPAWLLYGNREAQFAALIFATLLGCTDFVDGYLARKQGSTVLGSLMDPIADKVFIAIAFLPAVDLGWVPAWTVALLFVREFLVTAARTIYEARGQQLKSTYFARYKTWVQMCGIGVIMLMYSVDETTVDWLLGIAAVAPVAFFAIRYLLVRKAWKGAAWFAVSFTGVLLFHMYLGNHAAALALMAFIVGVTWVSGLGYLTGIGTLRAKGRVIGGEVTRLVTSVALPALAVWAQRADVAPKWAIFTIVSVELAHGGLDNLLAHHRVVAGGWSWGGRVLTECAMLALAAFPLPFVSSATAAFVAKSAAIAGAATSIIGAAFAFWQKREYYLGPKGDKLRGSAAPKASGNVLHNPVT